MQTLLKIFSSNKLYLKLKSLTFKWIYFTVTLLFLLPTLSAAQSNYYVSPDGDNVGGTNTCLDSDEPCATIAYAISVAATNSTIHLSAGEYTEPGLVIDKQLTIQGNGQTDTFIQGHPESPELATNRVLHINQAGNVVLKDFTVRHGRVTGNTDGGGIYVNNTPVELTNVAIGNNSAGRNGAGIYLTASQATENPANFTNVTIRENTGATSGAGNGGGIYVNSVVAELTNTNIVYNTARTGGGLYMVGASADVYLLNSKINNNESMGEGGGVRMGSPLESFRMENSEVTGNKAGVTFASSQGGGMDVLGSVQLENVIVSNNTAPGVGGGINFTTSSATPGVMTLKNVSINGNSSDGNGGGMFIINNIVDLSNVQITGNQSGGSGGGVHLSFGNTEFYMVNSVVSNNEAGQDAGGLFFSGGSTNTGDYSVVNSVISNNMASRNGGGITIGSNTFLANVTLTGNQAENVGGGLWILDGAEINITNSILWGNVAARENDPGHEIFHQNSTTALSYSLFANNTGDIVETSGNLSIDNPVNLHPRFIDVPDDLSVNENSSAINAGDPDTDLSLFPFDESDNPVDLAGNPRVFNERIDIGAYEFQGDYVPPLVPEIPILSTPEDEADDIEQPVTLQWQLTEHADRYRVQLQSAGSDFSELLFDEFTEDTGITLPELDELTEFEWRVQAYIGPYDESGWSEVWSFTTEQQSIDSPLAVNDTVYVATGDVIEADLLRNDSDPQGEAITIIALDTEGTLGVVTIGDEGFWIQYEAPGEFNGIDSFQYTIQNESGETSEAEVIVNVQPGLSADRHTIALYKFEEENTALVRDYSGSGNTASGIGTSAAESPFGTGRYMDGLGDYINMDVTRQALQGSIEWTIEFTAAAIDSLTGPPGMINHSCGNGWVLLRRPGNTINYGVKSNTTGCTWQGGSFQSVAAPLMDTRWHHYVLTWKSGDFLRVYQDGGMLIEVPTSGVFQITQSFPNFANLGRSDSGAGSFQEGFVDEVRVSNIARTSEEVMRTFLILNQYLNLETESRPGIVTLIAPVDGAADISVNPPLSWETENQGESYQLQVSLAEDFASTIVDQTGIEETEYEVSGLESETQYFWRVRAMNDAGDGDWSEVWSFTTMMTTSTDNEFTEIPDKLELEQNYPNPFNPSTQINFGLPESGPVKLQVFDLLGRRVTTLVDGPMQAGRQSIMFDASNLPSGMYLYRLEAPSNVLTRKMMLIK